MINDTTVNRVTKIMPFQTAITYYRRNTSGLGTATDRYTRFAIPQARSRKATKKDAPLSIEVLSAVEIVWELYQNVLATVSMPNPQKDDYLVDAGGQEWTVIKVSSSLHGTVFNLMCRRRVGDE